jgi:hypothetical protein
MGALLAAAGCATTPPPGPPAPPAPGSTAVQVERVRAALQVTPLELVMSGARGVVQEPETVGLRNTGDVPLQLDTVEIVGPDADSFRLEQGARLPLLLAPGKQLALGIRFAPPATAGPGVRRAVLRVVLGPRGDAGPPVDLAGLVTAGRTGEREPPLAQILDALGFRVDTGSPGPRLGVGSAAVGAEVLAPRFRRARPGAVSLYPVARFASNERIPYGIEVETARQPLGAIAANQGQTLNPELEPDGRTTFDPGDRPFGVYETTGRLTRYTADPLNGGRHSARVFPLVARTGGRLPDAYAVAFDEDGDGDYQDCVFVLWNVALAPP